MADRFNATTIILIVIGVIVLVGSFYTGYITGQNQQLREQLSGRVAAPTQLPAQPGQAQNPTPQGPPPRVDVALGDHTLGDKNAPVKIVEFSDFQCPYCKQFYDQTEKQLIDTYVKTGKASLSYRNFPLPFHQNALIAAQAGECAGKQGKFWQLHDTMFTKGQADGTGLDAASLKQYAADLGMDANAFSQCLDGNQTQSVIEKDVQDGTTAGVQGTPTFYVNGLQVVGAQPFNVFQQAIDAELNQTK